MKEGVIAILDALGVKGIWARTETKEVIKSWNDVIQDFNELKKLHNEDEYVESTSKVVAFSDTVIITHTGDNDLQLLLDIALHITWPFCNALMNGIFFRGVITKGKFYQTKSMTIGPAVDEAMDWYERHDWMGVTLAPSASFTLDQFENEGHRTKWYTRYDVPINGGIDKNAWVLAWPKFLDGIMREQKIKGDPKSKLLESFSNAPIGTKAISKYKNTIEFYDKIKK